MSYSVIAKFLSFVIELMIADRIGASNESDVYYLVNSIYSITAPMISVGIWKVYMPAYKERYVLERYNEANTITDKLLVVFIFISVSVIALVNMLPQFVVRVFAPGFSDYSVQLSIPMLRIISLLFIVGIISTFSSAILQSHNLFKKSQIKGIIQHIPPIVYLLFGGGHINAIGIVISIVIGEVLSTLIMWLFTKRIYKFHFPHHIFSHDIIALIRLVPTVCLNSIINQLNGIIDKAFSSHLQVGSITCLNYGSKVCSFFDGVFSTAVSTAVFPTLTEMAAKNEKKRMGVFISKYLSGLSAVLVAFTFLVTMFSYEIVDILFGHGNFNVESVAITSSTLMMYGFGLIAMCFTTIINDLFFIYREAKILLLTTLCNIFLNVVLNTLFIGMLGVSGLALATSVSLYISLIIKIIYIRRFVVIDNVVYKNVILLIVAGVISSLTIRSIVSRMSNSLTVLIVGSALFLCVFILVELLINRYYFNLLILAKEQFKGMLDRNQGGAIHEHSCSVKVLYKDISLDRKNNSTKSFVVLLFYRLMHFLYIRKHTYIFIKLLSVFKLLVFWIFTIDAQISYKAVIGSDIRLPHSANGVIISSKAIIGNHVTVFHQVTIGINERRKDEEQRIEIGDNCYLSTGCKVISCVVGNGSRIGPNAVVYQDLPENTLYVSTNMIVGE